VFCQRQIRFHDEAALCLSKTKRSHESDDCPHCKRPLEIAAINLTLLGRNVARCAACWRISAFAASDRLLFPQRHPWTFLATYPNPRQKGDRCRADCGYPARQCFLPLLLSMLAFRRSSFPPPPDICPQHVHRDAIDDEQEKQQAEGNRDDNCHVELLLAQNCFHRKRQMTPAEPDRPRSPGARCIVESDEGVAV
jgi:hypothetical protein